MHESLMQVRNLRNLEAFSRIDSSSLVRTFLGEDGGTSVIRQWDMLSTSNFFKPSKIITKAPLDSTVHRTLSTFKFGRNATSVDAKRISHGPIILSSAKFLQFLAISSMTYGGFAMLGIVSDSRSSHIRIALHIPVFFILFQAGITRRLSRGHLKKRRFD